MADLEESGYLVQPHTSSGRMPSRAGYHLYIDSLMDAPAVPAQQRRYIAENLAAAPAEAEPLMNVTTHLLSELTSQIGIVVTPAMGDTVLKAVDFLPLSDTRALCVVVAASGFIDNKVIDLKQPLAREELVRIGNYLTDNFAGLTLRQIRDRLLALMSEERAQVDSLLANAILLARQALAVDSGPEVLVEGTSSVLHQPELANVERVRRLLDTFTQRARLVQVLGSLIEGRGVRVVIGADSDLTSELDFSLVATTYATGGSARGTLGIFGPSRMEYQRVIPLVHFLGEALSEALEAAYGEGAGEAAREGNESHERRERH
jgi:heat-inducible transcriptional repressor